MTKHLTLSPGNAQTRQTMRQAHDDGRHGNGSSLDVLQYWASICADCNAIYRYEHSHKS